MLIHISRHRLTFDTNTYQISMLTRDKIQPSKRTYHFKRIKFNFCYTPHFTHHYDFIRLLHFLNCFSAKKYENTFLATTPKCSLQFPSNTLTNIWNIRWNPLCNHVTTFFFCFWQLEQTKNANYITMTLL